MNREQAPSQSPSTPVSTEQRVSVLVGDRLCIKCGYNLVGQSVIREPHYQMLIVRCPECGTVASLQEYPLLGRWANRWAALLAAIWFLLMLAFVFGGGAMMFGFSIGTAHEASTPFNQYVGSKYQAHMQQLVAANPGTTPGYTVQEIAAWRDAQDFDQLFQQAGGWKSGVNWYALALWIPSALCLFAVGCFASIALMTHRKRARIFVGVFIICIAVLFSYLFGYLDWVQQQRYWYWSDAILRIGPTILLMSLAGGAAALFAGLLLGRKFVRGLLRILLPPRLLHSLAMLWIVDGLQPPRINRN